MMIREDVHSDLAIPPGEYLEEVLAGMGMTKYELARRMDRPASKLSPIFSGNKAITPDTALQLEKVVGVPAHIWTGLEAEYRLTLARQQQLAEEKRLKDESDLVRKFCYAELVNHRFVEKKSRPTEKVLELQKYFGVTSLRNVSMLKRYQVAFRRGRSHTRQSPEAVAAWLRIGELHAARSECAPFSKESLKTTLPRIRRMTHQMPERFQSVLHRELAKAGVALVLAPHLSRTYAHGATFWLGPKKAVLMLTIRGRWADIFWFSLLHEIGHVLIHKKQSVFLELDDGEDECAVQEQEADKFAADILIPPSDYRAFLEVGSFQRDDIVRFAERIGVDPGVVVGRLQHDGHFQNSWHNGLRSRFEWTPSQS